VQCLPQFMHVIVSASKRLGSPRAALGQDTPPTDSLLALLLIPAPLRSAEGSKSKIAS